MEFNNSKVFGTITVVVKFPVSVNSITGFINWKVKQESY